MENLNKFIPFIVISFFAGSALLFSGVAYGLQSGSQEFILPNKDQFLIIPNVIQSTPPNLPTPTLKLPQDNSSYATNPILQNPTLPVPNLPRLLSESSPEFSRSSATIFQAPRIPDALHSPSIRLGPITAPEKRAVFPSPEIHTNTPSLPGKDPIFATNPGRQESEATHPTFTHGTANTFSESLGTKFEQTQIAIDSFSQGLKELESLRTEFDRGLEVTPEIQERINGFREKFLPELDPPIHAAGGQGDPPSIPNPIEGASHPAEGQTGGATDGLISSPQDPIKGPGGGISRHNLNSDNNNGKATGESAAASQPAVSDAEISEDGSGNVPGNENQVSQKKEWVQGLKRFLEEGRKRLESKKKDAEHSQLLLIQRQIDKEDREHSQANIPLPAAFLKK